MDAGTRADQAKSLLTNPVFEEAFKTLEKYYLDQMANTSPHEVQERNEWHTCLFNLKSVKTALTGIIQNGTIERINANRREKLKNDATGTGRDKRKRTSSR